jgi:phage shock protein E
MIRVLLVILFTVSMTLSFGQTLENVKSIEFKQLADSIPEAVIIDLRTADELKTGIIPNAINIDFLAKDFETQIGNLDPLKPYFIYCAGGGRSGETAELMSQKGFKQVYNLQGGFTAWKKAGMPIVPYKRK